VHRGLLHAAVWLLDRDGPALRRMVAEAEPGRCKLVRGPLTRRGRGREVLARAWPRRLELLRDGTAAVHVSWTHRSVRRRRSLRRAAGKFPDDEIIASSLLGFSLLCSSLVSGVNNCPS
jgi:hypothetical protein